MSCIIFCQNCKTKTNPLSETMDSGRPWYLKIWFRNSKARSGAVSVSTVGMKCAACVNQSQITHIESQPWEVGSLTMKSMEMDLHGQSGISSGCRRP